MKIKTVIIEDNEYIAEMLMILLSSHSRIEVVKFVVEKNNAIEEINRIQPILVFCDINIINGTGIEVLEECKGNYKYVIMTTSYDSSAFDTSQFSIIGYLDKNFKEKELVDLLNQLYDKLDNNGA